jgi:hypothetical protein
MRFTKFGVTEIDCDRATAGVTLFTPLLQKQTYLIGMRGEILHDWELSAIPGNYGYLLPNGNLLIAVKTEDGPPSLNAGGGAIQELDWDGNTVWEFHDDYQHHDFRRCANGNTIYLGWELLPVEHAVRVCGGEYGLRHPDGIWGDYIREVNHKGETIWEWHMWENMDIEKYPNAPMSGRREWAHANSIMPLKNGDVMVSWRHNNLIAVIDRQTGQFNFEWCDNALGFQHDFQILDNGNYMVFVNQKPGAPGGGSQVLEFDPKTKDTVWDYEGNPRYTFHSPFISGAQRLKSGNTLICEGMWGRIFEVTPDKDLVWEYVSPFFTPQDETNSISNCIFRAYRYDVDGPEIQNRISLT